MKMITPKLLRFAALGLMLVFAARAHGAAAPETTPDGLALVKKTSADLVYRRPGATFGDYKKILLVEPTIAFRKHWKTDSNFTTPSRPVTDADMQKIIVKGKELLLEALATQLTKAGYPLAAGVGPDVLAVKPQILDLDVFAPEPDNLPGTMAAIYTKGVGEGTLVIELFDSVSGQLLARAFDKKSSEENRSTWTVPRNQASNTADARRAFADWSAMLAQGLERAKAAEGK